MIPPDDHQLTDSWNHLLPKKLETSLTMQNKCSKKFFLERASAICFCILNRMLEEKKNRASTHWQKTKLVSEVSPLAQASFLLYHSRHWPTGSSLFSHTVTEAKGYIKVQVICTCVWLWESPTMPLSLYCCLPPWPTTQDDNLYSRRQLSLIARQGSVEAGLQSNGSSTGTSSKPRKNLIKTVAECLLLAPSSAVRKHLQDSNIQRYDARKRWRVAHINRYLAKWDNDRNKAECRSSTDASPDMSDPSRFVKDRTSMVTYIIKKAMQHWRGSKILLQKRTSE